MKSVYKIYGVREKLLNKELDIIMLVDSTFWGSAKTGIIFTKEALFWRDSNTDNMGNIKLEDIKSLKISKDSFSSKIISINDDFIELVGISSTTLTCVYRLIIHLRKIYYNSKIRIYSCKRDPVFTDRAYELQCLIFNVIADGVFTDEERTLWKLILYQLGYIDINGNLVEENKKELLQLKAITFARFAEEINKDGIIDDLEKMQENTLNEMMSFFEEGAPSLGKVILPQEPKKKSHQRKINKKCKKKNNHKNLIKDELNAEIEAELLITTEAKEYTQERRRIKTERNKKKIDQKIEQKSSDQLRVEKIKEISAIFKKSPAAIARFLPQLVILKFMTNMIGGKFKQNIDYYTRLLFCFTRDHPIQATILITALADLLTSDNKKSISAISTIATVGIGASILSYRNELQRKDIKDTLKKFRPDYEFRDIGQPGKIFTGDGKIFFEVISKFGDPPKAFVQFKLTPEGKRRYDRVEIPMGEKFCSDLERRKAFISFVKEQKLYDVTCCMKP